MPRFLVPLSAALAIASAFVLYTITHETRAIEARVQAKERAIDKARADIAVLKAERAHLARPERIEPAARALGLSPPAAGQLIRATPPVPGQAATGSLAGSTGAVTP